MRGQRRCGIVGPTTVIASAIARQDPHNLVRLPRNGIQTEEHVVANPYTDRSRYRRWRTDLGANTVTWCTSTVHVESVTRHVRSGRRVIRHGDGVAGRERRTRTQCVAYGRNCLCPLGHRLCDVQVVEGLLQLGDRVLESMDLVDQRLPLGLVRYVLVRELLLELLLRLLDLRDLVLQRLLIGIGQLDLVRVDDDRHFRGRVGSAGGRVGQGPPRAIPCQ